jgi:hypothetical protein
MLPSFTGRPAYLRGLREAAQRGQAIMAELRDGKIVALRNYDCFYPWD